MFSQIQLFFEQIELMNLKRMTGPFASLLRVSLWISHRMLLLGPLTTFKVKVELLVKTLTVNNRK